MGAQPSAGRARDGDQVVDSATAGRDGDFALGRRFAQGVQLSVDLAFHVPEGVGDEVLVDAVEEHEECRRDSRGRGGVRAECREGI